MYAMKPSKSRRNRPPLSFHYLKRIGPYLFFVYIVISLLLYRYLLSSIKEPPPLSPADIIYPNNSDLACQIPKLQPLTSVVKAYLKSENRGIKGNICFYPNLFKSTLDGRIVPLLSKRSFSFFHEIGNCCYRRFSRGSDDENNIYERCHPLSLTEATKIPQKQEFIIILCGKEQNGSHPNTIYDLHLFAPLKPEVEERLNGLEGKERKPNVVIFGLDSVSRMNFLRSMPKSYSYLMDELNSVKMKGFHKVGDNTFDNLVPILTSQSGAEIQDECGKDKVYDDCPFIWKLFGGKGYRTSFAEDRPDIGLFNYAYDPSYFGFIKQPVDYYFRTFAVEAAERIANNFNLCYGPRLSLEVLIDNVQKIAYQMGRLGKPFFQFTWSAGITHEGMRMAKYGDPHLVEFLKWMKESGSLNNTLFILMSDHGWRTGEFINTIQGQLEVRLPLLYFVVPEWMKREYSRAYKNLLGNRERLVTTYDLYQLLLDILNPEGMLNDNIKRREMQLETSIPRGISPFLPIPKKRTCEMAAIDMNSCACNPFQQLSRNNTAVLKAALVAVEKINSILSSMPNCANFSLASVIMAQFVVQKDQDWEGVLVNFQTKPGNATFEALVTTRRSKISAFFMQNPTWKVEGTISRTSLYGNQSYCIHDRFLKPYCYCV